MPAQRIPWFKLWPEAVDHEKIAQLNDPEFRTWVTSLAKASQQPTRWRFASPKHAAVTTGRPLVHFRSLISCGLFDDEGEGGLWVHDWRQWQEVYPSDYDDGQSPNTPRRVRHHSANGTETVREHSANTPPSLPDDVHKSREERIEKKDVKETEASKEALSESSEPSAGDDRVDELYGHYKARVQPRSRLCPRKKIAARLKRFSLDELKAGIDHFADDPWWMEHNADKGAEWFFESDARAEQCLLLKPRGAQNVVTMNGAARKPAGGPPEVPSNSPFLKYVG